MAKNYMADVAKLLGVELNDEFELNESNAIYKLSQYGFFFKCGGSWMRASDYLLIDIIKGVNTIKKLPWMPKEEEHYYYIAWRRIDNIGEWKIRVETTFFTEFSALDNLRVAVGNCFRTKEDAEAQKYEVFKRLTGKDWHETYGKEGGNNAVD